MGEIVLRSELQWFAEEMEKVLRQNDHKTHWSKCDIKYLHNRLMDEIHELSDSVACESPPVVIIKEAVDVANFAMMLADVTRKKFEGHHSFERKGASGR